MTSRPVCSTFLFVHVLPAVVPEGEFPRAEVVPVRLTRKVAPLFGVPWAHEPFGRTWVCDFASLTLGEIARGAPTPSKDEQTRLDQARPLQSGAGAAETWEFAGRAVWTPGRSVAPTSLANATLNKFGPDTKAAVVLTAANRLLVDATEAVSVVCRHLVRHGTEPETALAVWAGLVLEVFRGQPALIVAAVQARAVQRSLTTRWGSQVALGGLAASSARCEIGAAAVAHESDVWRPVRLALVDDTLDALLGEFSVDRREDIAGAWCRRLLQMGRPGSGLVWLSESGDGHRAVYFYQRVGAMVAPFVDEVLDVDTSRFDQERGLTAWPERHEFDALPTLAARAHVVAAHVSDSYVRYARSSAGSTVTRKQRRAYLEQVAETATARLGAEDPAALLIVGYQEYMQLRDVAREPSPDVAELTEMVRVVLEGQQRTLAAFRAGRIDPGAASYLLEIGNVALHDARSHLGDTTLVDRHLVRGWREALTARGVDPEPWDHLDEMNDSQIFHLGYYAEFLSTRPSTADVRRALQILTAVAGVRDKAVANEPANLRVKHISAGQMHLMCAATAAELAHRTPPRERSNVAAAWATASTHAAAALANPALSLLFSDEQGGRAVEVLERLEPSLLHLLDSGESPDGVDWDMAGRLVDAVLAQLESGRVHSADKARIRGLKALRLRLTAAPFGPLPE
jgi:hypothetical protein